MKILMITPGFSLIELSMVVFLLMLIGGLGVSAVNFLNQFLIRSEMRKLQTICLYLQQSAYANNKPECIRFDIAQNAYVFDGKKQELPSGLRFGVVPGVMGSPGSPSTRIEKPITFVNNCITFYPNGSIQAGAVYCVDTYNNYMYALSCGIAHTSHIRLYHYNGTWHLLT